MVNVNPNLYVEIVPMNGPRSPAPHPVVDGQFDTSQVYKVLGCYSPSESSESYFMLSNQRREIWFISNRHVRAHSVQESSALFLPRYDALQSVGAPSHAIPASPIGHAPGGHAPGGTTPSSAVAWTIASRTPAHAPL
jgi:hypothetical protein